MQTQPQTQSIAPDESVIQAVTTETVAAEFAEFGKEIKVLEDNSLTEVTSSIRDTINAIDESLSAMEKGAKETIESITNAHLAEAETEGGAQLTSDELTQIAAAQNILAIVKNVRDQGNLILFAAQNRVPVEISETVGLVEKEFKQLTHVLRMYHLKGFTYDSVFKILRKHRTLKARKVTSFLYYFFKYLNSLKASNTFAQNVNYARFTSTLISTSLLAGVTLESNELLYQAITQQ